MTITDREIDNWFYTKYLHVHIRTIIHNVTYHFDFNSEQMLYEDVESDLLLHLQLKKDVLRKYSGNWYNIVFTIFKRKFYDILRSHKVEDDKVKRMVDLCNENMNLIAFELDEPEYQPNPIQQPEEVPEVLPIQRVEVCTDNEAAGKPIVRDMPARTRPAYSRKRSRSYRATGAGLQLTIGFPEFAIAM